MVGGITAVPDDASTTVLGDWYANLLTWQRPHVILVNAHTLVPVITPLAPAKGLSGRLPDVIADALLTFGISKMLVEVERNA